MHDFAIELGPVRRIRNSSHCFNGTDHGADGGYWTRRWMWSALSRVGGIFCFRCAYFLQSDPGKKRRPSGDPGRRSVREHWRNRTPRFKTMTHPFQSCCPEVGYAV
jgi:hypothetical protein